MEKKICSECGKHIRGEHISFDGTDLFCSKDCAVKCFDGDEGAVEILLDEGKRLWWEN